MAISVLGACCWFMRLELPEQDGRPRTALSFANAGDSRNVSVVRILLHSGSRLVREVLRREIQRDDRCHVVGEADDDWGVACRLRDILSAPEADPDSALVVLTTSDDVERLPASYERWLTEYPEIYVLNLSSGGLNARLWRVGIESSAVEAPLNRLSGLF